MNSLVQYNTHTNLMKQNGLLHQETVISCLRDLLCGCLISRPRATLYSSITILTFITVCIIMLHTGPVLNAKTECVNKKYFTTIEVQDGDTLWNIAQNYITDEYSDTEDYLNEVRMINHIIGDEITSGCYLTIPYYAEEPDR